VFSLFRRNRIYSCPIDEGTRKALEKAFLWLINTFGEDKIKQRKVLTPHPSDFPIKYDMKNREIEIMKIIAVQMELDPDDIQIDIYIEGQSEIDTGGALGNRLFLQQVEGEKYTGGLYWGRQEDNKYHIGIEQKKLNEPLDMIATLAHEMVHIKLLGEKRIDENNEPLTDLATIIFGLGIFNANAAFQIKNGIGYKGWSKLGYLSQMEWGYGLALLAYLQGEKSPKCVNFLSANVKADFKESVKFIWSNQEEILKEG
jgi:hypothetical protein